ncbi:MAG: hypothetical protein AB8F34_00380 [Akkermansiaceae bacterium]
MALEKIDGITGAYVNRGITLHFAKAGAMDKEKIAATLKPFKMTIKEVKALEGKPY